MIYISAGHSEDKQGAEYKGLTEYMLTTQWADHLVKVLGNYAVRVPNGRLKESVMFINNSGDADIAVEIHFNSFKFWKDLDLDGEVDKDEMFYGGVGCETLYYPGSEDGLALAEHIQSKLSRVFPPDRGVKEGWYRLNKKNGVNYFLQKTKCTAVIIEPEFIDNMDVNNLQDKMDVACNAIANALITI